MMRYKVATNYIGKQPIIIFYLELIPTKREAKRSASKPAALGLR
jgi:hypothetical protein